jgi:hypothetical protein
MKLIIAAIIITLLAAIEAHGQAPPYPQYIRDLTASRDGYADCVGRLRGYQKISGIYPQTEVYARVPSLDCATGNEPYRPLDGPGYYTLVQTNYLWRLCEAEAAKLEPVILQRLQLAHDYDALQKKKRKGRKHN